MAEDVAGWQGRENQDDKKCMARLVAVYLVRYLDITLAGEWASGQGRYRSLLAEINTDGYFQGDLCLRW